MFDIYLNDDNFTEPKDQIYYLLAANGLFQVKKTRFFKSSRLIFEAKRAKRLDWLKEQKEGIKLTMPQKIPLKLIKQIIGFFREVYLRYNKSEAVVLLYWKEKEKKFELVVPEQEISAAAVYYKVEHTPRSWLRVGTIHSHCDLKASHSSTDHKDEEHDDGLHITIGNLNHIPSYSCSVMADGIREIVPPESVIEQEKVESFPVEWLKKVKEVKAYVPAYPASNLIYGYKSDKWSLTKL